MLYAHPDRQEPLSRKVTSLLHKKSFLLLGAAILAAIPVSGAQAEVDDSDPFSGFYVGVHVGGSRGTFSIGERTVTRPSETVPGEDAGDPDIVIPASSQVIPRQSEGTGIKPLAGGQLGFNIATRSMLFGVEAEAQLSTADATSSLTIVEEVDADSDIPPRQLASEVIVDPQYTGSVRLRAGMRQQDLVYFVTGGIAAARVDVDSTGTTLVANGDAGTRTVTASDSATLTGWTGGVGILGWFGGHAIGGVELRYTDYGSKTYDVAGTVDTPTVPTEIGFTDIQLLIRMNYLF